MGKVAFGREEEMWGPLCGLTVEGYEIHMGESVIMEDGQPFCILEDGRADGCVSGRVLGTYLHGIFENTGLVEELLKLLCEDRGLAPGILYAPDTAQSYRAFKESQYDILADAVREHLDMERIYEIIDRT